MVEITVALIAAVGVILAATIPSWITKRDLRTPNGKRVGEMVYETNTAVADLQDAFRAHVEDPVAHEDVSADARERS